MIDIPSIAEVASLIGDPARANMLSALKDDRVLTSSELAAIAGVMPSTASGHLQKLMAARLVTVERRGRHRHFRLASRAVADAIEALETLAAKATRRPPARPSRADAARFARSCYDHLAGRLAVALAWSMVTGGDLAVSEGEFTVTDKGRSTLGDLGIDVGALQRASRRRLSRACLDWSEQRPHLGGALGAALFERLCALGWLARQPGTRAVSVTGRGRQEFRRRFGIDAEYLA
jgi:DNA-binding transcriptional ArsR family regulator